ncbi:MAG TPA: lipid-binding SYLF domain-containing protein [Pyrinomonadaceae bacterium]|nr:lipid-binding SYLF domain-containing protein [Pyrinomonadaceae bacterium]
MKSTTRFTISAVIALALAVTGAAQTKNAKKIAHATKEAQEAANVFTEVMNVPDKAIPQSLLDKAEAIAVFQVVKAGFIVGGRKGDGVISRRVKGGWSAPAFYNLTGGSFGLQIGASKVDVVLLFMNTGAVDSLMQDKFEIGGEGSAAAGPVGRSASASTDILLKAQILSYSRSKGLFAGLELKGVAITPDNNDNEPVYGMKADQVLSPSRAWSINSMPSGVRIFPRTLSRYSVRR